MADAGSIPNFAESALAGYQAGQALGKSKRRDAALGLLAQQPDDPSALLNLASVDPGAATNYQNLRTAQLAGQRDATFRTAATRWGLTSGHKGQNTLGSLIRSQAPQSGPNPDPANALPQSDAGGVLSPPVAPVQSQQGVETGPDVVVTARQSETPAPPAATAPQADDGYATMFAADPERALKMRNAMASATKADLDAYQQVNGASLQLMGGVHDQASYDEAKARGHELHERFGVGPDAMDLPEKYDPQVVQSLMMQAMKTSQQLAAVRAQKKLEWDEADDELDNARADRNTDSIIQDRGARRGLIARGQDLTDNRGRYGISVASGDRRRGQDISGTTSQRGQDMTDKRVRETGGRRSGGAAPVATAGKITRVAVGANGKKVGWNGAAWVPVQ